MKLIRINKRVALGLTVAQWASLALLVVGAALIAAQRPTKHTAQP